MPGGKLVALTVPVQEWSPPCWTGVSGVASNPGGGSDPFPPPGGCPPPPPHCTSCGFLSVRTPPDPPTMYEPNFSHFIGQHFLSTPPKVFLFAQCPPHLIPPHGWRKSTLDQHFSRSPPPTSLLPPPVTRPACSCSYRLHVSTLLTRVSPHDEQDPGGGARAALPSPRGRRRLRRDERGQPDARQPAHRRAPRLQL